MNGDLIDGQGSVVLCLMDIVALLGAWLFPSVVFLRRQVNNVHVDGLGLLQLRRNGAETVGHLVSGNGNVFALDARKGAERN